jgi:O-antigen/teichoic acid export membrane protein
MSDARRAEVRSRAIRGAVSVGLRNVAVRVLGLIGVVALSRLLDKHDFGLLAFGLAIKVLSDIIATGGLAAGLVRREAEPTREELGAMVFFQGGVSAVLVVVLAAAGLVWGDAAYVAAIMAAGLIVSSFRVPSVVMLERTLDWTLVAKAEVTENLLYNVLAVATAAIGFGVWGVAAASAFGALVGTIILIRVGPVGYVVPRPRFTLVRPMLRFGVRFQAVGLVSVFRDQGLNLLIAAVGGLIMLAVWSIAYRLLQVILLLLQSLWRVSYPAMARAMEAGDNPEFLVSRVLQVCTTVVAPLAAVLGGAAPAIVHVLFSASWSDAAPVLPWGAAALAIWGPVSTAATGFLQARGDVSRFLVVVVVQSLVWFAVAIALMPALDAEAVGIGMLASAIVYCLGVDHLVRRHASVPFASIMWAPLVAGSVATLGAAAVNSELGNGVLGLVAASATALAGYGALLGVLRRSDLLSVVALVRRRPGRAAGASV